MLSPRSWLVMAPLYCLLHTLTKCPSFTLPGRFPLPGLVSVHQLLPVTGPSLPTETQFKLHVRPPLWSPKLRAHCVMGWSVWVCVCLPE